MGEPRDRDDEQDEGDERDLSEDDRDGDGPADSEEPDDGSNGAEESDSENPETETPEVGFNFDDEKPDDPEEYVDEDEDPPDWVAEAKEGEDARPEQDDAATEDDDGPADEAGAAETGAGMAEEDDDGTAVDDDGTVEGEGMTEDDGTAGDEDGEMRAPEGPEVPDWVDDGEERDSFLGDDYGEAEGTDPADEDDVHEIGPTDTSSATGKASAGAPAGAQPAGAGGGMFGESATAPDDEEMPLTQHVEEMALRFMAVGLVVVGVGAITLFYADELINFLWYSFLGPGKETCLQGSLLGGKFTVTDACPDSVSPRVYHPLALVLARLKVASLVGLIAAMPVAVYQTYRFMRPGLYPRERRYYLAAVPTSLVLATVGVGFAYFAILPAMFSYFTNYSERAAEIAFGLTETFNLMILMIGFFALTFQIPLLVMLAIMMGVTTRRWLEDRRLYFWGGFAAVAFVFSPDPTGMAPLMVAVTMIGLFEGTLFLLRWTDSDSPLFSPTAFAERRPYAWGLAVIAGYLASTAPVPGSYYEQLPAIVRETLAFNELVEMTPVITVVVLILLFEVMAYMVRNNSRNVRVWHAVNRSRFPYWMLALVVGYFASPNPPGLQVAQQVTLPVTEAAAITAGLIIGFELLILGLRWRKKRSSAD